MSSVAPLSPAPAAPRAAADLSWSTASGFVEALAACGAGGEGWRPGSREFEAALPAPVPPADGSAERPREPETVDAGADAGIVDARPADVRAPFEAGAAAVAEPPAPVRERTAAEAPASRSGEGRPGGAPPAGDAVGAKETVDEPDAAAGASRRRTLPAAPRAAAAAAETGMDGRASRRTDAVRTGRAADERMAPPAPRGDAPDRVDGDEDGRGPARPAAGARSGAAAERWLLSLDARRLLPGEQVRALEKRWQAWDSRQAPPARKGPARESALAGRWLELRAADARAETRAVRTAARGETQLPALLERLSARVRLLAAGAEREAWLELEPASLGRLKVQLQEADGRWHLRLSAETPEALEQLKRGLVELEGALARQGLELGRVELALDPEAERRRQERERGSGSRGRNRGAEGADFVEQLDRHLRTQAPPAGGGS